MATSLVRGALHPSGNRQTPRLAVHDAFETPAVDHPGQMQRYTVPVRCRQSMPSGQVALALQSSAH